jgi:hypothetical protein
MTDQLYLIVSTGFGASSNSGHHKVWSLSEYNALPLKYNIPQQEQ